MAIDVLREQPITLEEAAKLLPPAADGRPTNRHTLRAWATRGLRGVLLETIFVGCRRMTTAEAIARFVADYTDARQAKYETRPTRTRPNRNIAAARARLASLHGID